MLTVAACSPATTPAPRATITFVVTNSTSTLGSFRFTGSAADVTGPICRQGQTVVGATWDPVWRFALNGRRVIGSTDSADLQPGPSARNGLTVMIVVDPSGARSTAHAGPPLSGEVAPVPSPAPTC